MITWTRATREQPCGGCGAKVYTGQPLQVWTIAGVRRALTRCRLCATGAPPADLPELPVPQPAPPRAPWVTVESLAERFDPHAQRLKWDL